ncbi:hypothetical protein NMY22_g14881 [Coprinellus aureogranulatus]|nr:hypothetical protein NMY22_g14881 [Coprinellus aureogranulatus]
MGSRSSIRRIHSSRGNSSACIGLRRSSRSDLEAMQVVVKGKGQKRPKSDREFAQATVFAHVIRPRPASKAPGFFLTPAWVDVTPNLQDKAYEAYLKVLANMMALRLFFRAIQG